jgi:hypothetical protein
MGKFNPPHRLTVLQILFDLLETDWKYGFTGSGTLEKPIILSCIFGFYHTHFSLNLFRLKMKQADMNFHPPV